MYEYRHLTSPLDTTLVLMCKLVFLRLKAKARSSRLIPAMESASIALEVGGVSLGHSTRGILVSPPKNLLTRVRSLQTLLKPCPITIPHLIKCFSSSSGEVCVVCKCSFLGQEAG